MDDKQRQGLIKVIDPISNALAMLENLKKRIPMGMKELEAHAKSVPPGFKDIVKHLMEVHGACKKLGAILSPAIKAASEIEKLPRDKKKTEKMSVDEAKKKLISLAKPLQDTYLVAIKVHALWGDLPRDFTSKASFTAALNYCDMLGKYMNIYKVELGKWK